MVVFVSLVLAGALRAVLSSCRALWALGVQSWSSTCSDGLSSWGSKKGGSIEPPLVGGLGSTGGAVGLLAFDRVPLERIKGRRSIWKSVAPVVRRSSVWVELSFSLEERRF